MIRWKLTRLFYFICTLAAVWLIVTVVIGWILNLDLTALEFAVKIPDFLMLNFKGL